MGFGLSGGLSGVLGGSSLYRIMCPFAALSAKFNYTAIATNNKVDGSSMDKAIFYYGVIHLHLLTCSTAITRANPTAKTTNNPSSKDSI